MTQPVSSDPPPARNQYPPSPAPARQADPAMMIASLGIAIKRGATNFYLVAALSVLNSIFSAVGFGLAFYIGLSITQIVDGMAVGLGENLPSLAVAAKIAGLIISILIAGGFSLFCFFCRKGARWGFFAGMVLFALAGIFFLGEFLLSRPPPLPY